MPWKEEYRSLRRSNSRKMGGKNSKHVIINNGVVSGMEVPNPWVSTSTGCGLMLLPSFLRRRKTTRNEKYYMDATTSRFFLGDTATIISTSCSTDSIVTIITDQADDPKNTVSSKSTLSSSASSSTGGNSSSSNGSENEYDHILPSDHCRTNGEHFPPQNHNTTTTCCVDDYLIYSTDSDSFVDRYDVFVSIICFVEFKNQFIKLSNYNTVVLFFKNCHRIRKTERRELYPDHPVRLMRSLMIC
jgi:hypothetical protein